MGAVEGVYIKKIGENKGRPRLWLEGSSIDKAGFKPGQRYDVRIDGTSVVLQANPDGSRLISSKQIGEKRNPIIDINSAELLALFDGMSSVRVVMKENAIYVLPLASEVKKQERFARTKQALESGEPFKVGSLTAGMGVLNYAIHSGLEEGGIETRLAFINEIRPELLEHAEALNKTWTKDTLVIQAPLQEAAFDEYLMSHLPKVEILEMGLPCSGASVAGRAKRGLAHPEDHPEVGHLAVSALVVLAKCNPAYVIFENVPQYAQSASASIIRSQLKDMGYVTHETTLNGSKWGALENRTRWCMVAATEGLPFSFDMLQPGPQPEVRVRDILEPVPLDDPSWKSRQGLKDKQLRDEEKGNGFKMALKSYDDTSINTVTKGYAKDRTTDPTLLHPENPELSRLFTPIEHARAKGIPEWFVDGLSATRAHEGLGQSVVVPPFQALGKHLALTLRSWDGKAVRKPARVPDGTLELAGEVVATLTLADSNGRYKGPIVAEHKGALVQDIGSGQGVLHFAEDFKNPPKLGQRASLEYSNGSTRSRDLTPSRGPELC